MSSSHLQRKTSFLLYTFLSGYDIRENTRPDWLITPDGERLELDFFIPDLNIAIEVQGRQHYEYSPHFHGDPEGFRKRLRFDRYKREVCERRGIQLIEVTTFEEMEEAVLSLLPKPQVEIYPSRIKVSPKDDPMKKPNRLEKNIRNTERRIERFWSRVQEDSSYLSKHPNMLAPLEAELTRRKLKRDKFLSSLP